MYEIRKIHSNEVMEALALALEVFLQFEAPDVNKVSALYMRRLTRVK